MPKRKRTTDALFARASQKKKSVLSWYDKLSVKDRQFVLDVVKESTHHPDLSTNSIAVALIEELGITSSRKSVHVKLQELRNAQTKR